VRLVLGQADPLRLAKEGYCTVDLLGEMPMPSDSYLRRFSLLWHLVSEGEFHDKERANDREIQKHTAACSC